MINGKSLVNFVFTKGDNSMQNILYHELKLTFCNIISNHIPQTYLHKNVIELFA